MDNNLFENRLKRYFNAGFTVSGLLARLAGEKYLGLTIDHLNYAENLTQSLGKLKGPLVKIVQLLATIPGALPQEYAEELKQLQSNAPAMGWLFVKRRMTTELGSAWLDYFQHFEQQASAAASLGQIHKAVTKEQEIVACKLQYPAMESTVQADLAQLKIAAQLYESFNNAINTSAIQQEISERLMEELDYSKEAQHMQWYAHMLKEIPQVYIPRPLEKLSTHRLLTMQWLEGSPLLTAVHWDQDQRNALAKLFFKAWYHPFYHYGIIHGDPHLGNYTVREDGGLNLFDFGCVRKFSASFVQGVIDLYHSLLNNDETLAEKAYHQWGFTNITKELMAVLNKWARFLYGPLLENRVRLIEETNNSNEGKRLAEEIHHSLRAIGGVSPPKEFVFIDRATVGVGSVMMHLKAELNWYALFQELIHDFNPLKLEQQQQEVLSLYPYK